LLHYVYAIKRGQAQPSSRAKLDKLV
jgi:hypothetical protein